MWSLGNQCLGTLSFSKSAFGQPDLSSEAYPPLLIFLSVTSVSTYYVPGSVPSSGPNAMKKLHEHLLLFTLTRELNIW